jgi:hypothetical protein
MNRLSARAACAALAAGVLSICAGALPAQGSALASSAGAGWRLDQRIGAASVMTLPGYGVALAAPSPDSAWSIWQTCSETCETAPAYFVEHWNGRTWTRVSSTELPGLTSPIAIVASSPSDAWVFSWLPGGPATARHWNGKSWRELSVPSWVVRANLGGQADVAAADLGGQVWVFSLGDMSFTKTTAFAARYANGRWTKAALPYQPYGVSAVSADDIWALGGTGDGPSGHTVLMRWNGRAWSTSFVPAQHLAPKTLGDFAGIAGSGPKDVWLTWDTDTGVNAADIARYLLHLTVRGWARVGLPAGTTEASILSADGHGGLWVAGNGPAKAYQWRFFHWTDGHWALQAVPVPAGQTGGVNDLTRVPGTSALWAVGLFQNIKQPDLGPVGAIWAYALPS